MSSHNLKTSNEEIYLMVKIANYYYNEELTQQEIAERIGINRVRVNQLLKQAKQQGIVRITIHNKVEEAIDIASEIKKKSGLDDVIITPSTGPTLKDNKQAIGIRAAQFIENYIQDGQLIGLGWGTSIYETIMALNLINPLQPRNITVVPLVGGVGEVNPHFRVNTLVQIFSDKFKAKWIPLEAPYIVENDQVKQSLISHPIIHQVINAWDKLDIAIIGIGAAIAHSPLLKTKFFGNEQIIDLEQHGLVGDILDHFYDENGRLCLPELDKKIISISLEQIKKTKKVIAISGGVQKVNSIMAAIRADYIDILITDLETGLALSRLL